MLFRRFGWVSAVLVCVLGVPGCGRDEGAKPAAAAASAAGPKDQAPEAAPAAEKPAPAVALTPEMEGAALCVQVMTADGGLREHVGAMLRAEDLGVRGECTRRFAAVLLPDYDEKALRAPGCELRVLRRKFDAQGTPRMALMRGTLVHFEPGSRVAVLRFAETFAWRLDAGLAVAQGGAAGSALLGAELVRPGAPLAAGQQLPVADLPESLHKMLPDTLRVVVSAPLARREGLLWTGAAGGGAGAWLPGVVSVPVLSAEGALAGFAQRRAGRADGWELVPGVALPAAGALPAEGPRFVPVAAALGQPDEMDLTTVMVKGELYDPEREFGRCQVLLKRTVGREVPAVVVDAQADQPALEGAEPATLGHLAEDGTLLFALRPPPVGTQEEALLVQVVLARADGAAVFHSAPFMLVSKWMSKRAFFQVEGLRTLLKVKSMPQAVSLVAGTAGAPVAAGAGGMASAGGAAGAGGAASAGGAAGLDPAAAAVAAAVGDGVLLKTESPILYGVPLREGREVLLRLEGAPFWKRLSVAEGRWLPLPVPEAELQACRMAGNKEALFVLHTGLQELRRYAGEDLQLEKKVTLPDGMAYRDVAAGCLSAEAPLAVVADQGLLAYGPRDLAPGAYSRVRGTSEVLQAADPFYHVASGDGLGVWPLTWSKKNYDTPSFFQYLDALGGFAKASSQSGHLPGAGRAWRMSDDDGVMLAPGTGWRSWTARARNAGGAAGTPFYRPPAGSLWGPMPMGPHLVVLSRPGDGMPSRGRVMGGGGTAAAGRAVRQVPVCSFVAYGASEPWAAVEMPEIPMPPAFDRKTFSMRVWLDARALKFAVWHEPQALLLHELKPEHLLPTAEPVLACYPDCHVPPGGEFRFKPELVKTGPAAAAGAAPVVTLVDAPEGMTVGADGTLSWKAPAVSAVRQVDFGLKVELAGAQRACELRVRLELDGLPQVLAMAPPQVRAKKDGSERMNLPNASDEREARTAARAEALKTHKAVALSSRFYASETPVQQMLAGLDDYLCLRLADKTLALFSVKEWKVAGSLRLEDSMTFFPAGDSVLVHDSLQHTLTRYSLPDFKPVLRHVLPAAAELRGVAVGTAAAGPVTLLLEEPPAAAARPGLPQLSRPVLQILDKQTLSPGAKWAAYAPPDEQSALWLRSECSTLREEAHPQHLLSSPDGRLVRFSSVVLVVTPVFTTAFPDGRMPGAGIDSKKPLVDRVFTSGDLVQRRVVSGVGDRAKPQGSPCGHYLTDVDMEHAEMVLRLLATDDARPLLRLENVAAYDFDDGPRTKESLKRQVLPLGEKNLLATLSLNGRLLQVTHVDLGAVLRAVDPGAAYVTSRPFPVALEGRTLEYRLTLSDAAAASSYELAEAIPGAAVNNLGVFTYKAPAKVDAPQLVHAGVKIRLKNGQTALHQFPIYLLPTPAALSGKKGR